MRRSALVSVLFGMLWSKIGAGRARLRQTRARRQRSLSVLAVTDFSTSSDARPTIAMMRGLVVMRGGA